MAARISILSLFLILILLISGSLVSNVYAQSPVSNQIVITSVVSDSSYFLGEWVLPESITVWADSNQISSRYWTFDEYSGMWKLRGDRAGQKEDLKEVIIRYEFLPLVIRRKYQNRQIRTLDSVYYESDTDSLGRELIRASGDQGFQRSDLQQRGSLSRGIIVGSNQDFALESGLNFELNGQLTDDVSINASLTDRSIPFQPDGTTQNIREFDRVFIQLNAPSTTIEMGDVDVSFEQSTFARLNRRLQGAAGYTSTGFGEYSGAVSVVRGTFKSQSFTGRDGVQGPYRLTGREGEEFVIILAGTERVYINGQLVQRGEENDYIIDYSLGEVYFTNNLLIKDETRIYIEYEYIDQNFNRTLVAAEGGEEFLDGRFSIGASVIRQADGDELLSQQALSEDDIDVLRGVGDDLDAAVVPGERLATQDDESNIRYAKVDTTLNGQTYTVFKNIPGSDQSHYVVRFSKVEEGNGSYRRVSGTVNGILYEWVGPGNGEYEPFRRLPAPEQQQMVALNSRFEVNDNVELFGEWAASSFDQNRFSDLDDNDNNDISYQTGFRIKELNTAIGKVEASASRRYTGQNFRFFERTREVEFDRKWNISRTGDVQEAINEANLSIMPTENTRIGGEYGFIERNNFKGYRQASTLNTSNENGLDLNYKQDWVRSEDEILDQKGEWFRHQGQVSKSLFESWTPFIRFEQENRKQRSVTTDSLLNTSLAFYEVGLGIRYSSSKLEFEAGVVYRQDRAVLDNQLENQSSAIEQRYRLRLTPSDYFRTQNEVAIRSKSFTSAFEEQGNTNRRGLLIRSVTDYETANSAWNGQFFYEASTRRQAILQEAYIEVGPELGQYVWIDSNDDGVQQIDEFFPELSPNEGIYVRQFLPSDQLLPVIDLKTRFRNEIAPFQHLKDEDDLAGFLRGMVIRSRINIEENSTTRDLEDVYLLKLSSFRNDSTTIQGRLFWEKELGLFTINTDIDLTIGYNQSRSLNQRSTESQSSFNDLYFLNSSLQVSSKVRLYSDLNIGTSRSLSDRLSSRNFDIRSYSVVPGAEVLINRSWQSSFSVSYARKEDRFPLSNVSADILKVVNTHRAYLFRKVQANARLELRNAAVNGNSSTLGAFELTEGTGIGTNLIWSLAGSYRLSDLIRLSINYDGRTVRDRANIHTAKLVVSAVF